MRFRVAYHDIFEGVYDEVDAIDQLLEYLRECVENRDVTAFDFQKVEDHEP